jgi:ATP-binding protein involved in chromosome partitioning
LDKVSIEEKGVLDPAVEAIRKVLSGIDDPHMKRDLIAAGEVDEVIVDGEVAKIRIVLGYPAASWTDSLESMVQERVISVEGIQSVDVAIETQIVGHEVQKGVTPINGVRNMIAVASGKGGVGKSTVSVNLALALVAEGSRVGILDADIYGPSQPRMLGIGGQPKSPDGKSVEPMISHQLQAMSIGFLIDEETPMIWRGPMVTQALEQLLNDTRWDDLDYLVIDLPPGTGDTQLTLAQKVPVSGALIVTTPQDIALLDAKKALKMFEKVEIPVLGVVENMSTHICSSCGHEEHIFGEGGGSRMANEYEIDFLGEIPLARSIREGTDSGKPTVVSEPKGELAEIYRNIARNVSGRLAGRKRDYTDVFPTIVIQNS